MQDTITTMFCLCDDFLKASGHCDDLQCRVSSAEIMTVPLVACAFFGGNMALSRRFLFSHGYFTHDLSASRFCRRLHALSKELWRRLFRVLGHIFVRRNPSQNYVVDSFPVPACDNIRIKRCKLLQGEEQGEEHRGYIASKRRFFYGLRVHCVVTGQGEPIEFVVLPGSTSDITAFKSLDLDLPAHSSILADRAYNDYKEEDLLREAAGIILQPQRKKNSKRPLAVCREFLFKPIRQRIETALSQVTKLFPKLPQAHPSCHRLRIRAQNTLLLARLQHPVLTKIGGNLSSLCFEGEATKGKKGLWQTLFCSLSPKACFYCATITIHDTPNLSATVPKLDAQNIGASGI